MEIFKNVVTFGAEGRIKKKINEFDNLKNKYNKLYKEMENKKNNVNKILEKLIKIKVQSVQDLKKINEISKNLKGKDREVLQRKVGNEFENVSFEKIKDTISAGETAINATKGVSAGLSTALGTWALVSTVGTASTGTAISSLSGAAATNAILAWFGGGSVAAGGGGMAAGTAILGGIIVVPALALTGVFNHLNANKKIKEIEEKMKEMIDALDKLKKNILRLDLIEERSTELINSLEKSRKVFKIEFEKVYNKIYPIPILSKLIKNFRKKVFGVKYFSEKDVKHIAYIGGIASDFAKLIDTKILE